MRRSGRAPVEGSTPAWASSHSRAGPVDLDAQVLLGQGRVEVLEQDVGDQAQLGRAQRVEDDDLVDPVDELGAEGALELAEDLLLDPLEAVVLALHEPHAAAAQHQLGADVRGHQHHRVLEVHVVAVGVGEDAVLEDLEQQVADVGVRLLDLVEQEHRVGLAADALGELAALLVADVARGRADQLGDGVLLHVLRHVEAHQRVLGPEQELGEPARHLGLPHSRRSEEHERADRPLRIGDAEARAADRA